MFLHINIETYNNYTKFIVINNGSIEICNVAYIYLEASKKAKK